ncbi:SMI1/KNR4 family protein [Catellatospora coxensis]
MPPYRLEDHRSRQPERARPGKQERSAAVDNADVDDEFPRRWAADIAALAAELQLGFEARFGYPPDEHRVAPPAAPEDLARLADLLYGLRLPGDLLEFYRATGGVSLPDVGNAYFISGPRDVRRPGRTRDGRLGG